MKITTAALAFLACSLRPASAQLNYWAKKAGLKYFGTATDTPGQRERAGYESVYPQYDAIFDDPLEFGGCTPSNAMKWTLTEPNQNEYNYTEGDLMVHVAETQGKVLRCHTLAYWAGMPTWVYYANWTAETLEAAIVAHIQNVATHFKGRCYAWDVVNEALDADGVVNDQFLSPILGDEYIKIAFRETAKADPDAKLYYNDAGIEYPGPKADGVVALVQMLRAEGLRIDGIGLQSHFIAGKAPTLDQQKAVMDMYGSYDLEVAITELDVGINVSYTVNDTVFQWQKEVYTNAVGACVQSDACVGITVWDFYDPFSWLIEYGSTEDYGDLWFANFTKHPAYDGCIYALQNGTRGDCDKKRTRFIA